MKLKRKLLAGLLTLCMAVGMAVPAFAANGPSFGDYSSAYLRLGNSEAGTTVLHTSGSVIRRMGIRRSLPTAARLTMYQVLFMIRRATPLP